VRLWDIHTGQIVDCLGGNNNTISLVFTPDGQGLICGGMDGMIKYWDLGPLLRSVQQGALLKQSYEVCEENMGLAAKEESGKSVGVSVCTVEFIGYAVCNRSFCLHSFFVSVPFFWNM
jgi:WD40 repeat protein